MEFGTDKCATLILKRGKITKFVRISLQDGIFIKGLIEGADYKYTSGWPDSIRGNEEKL